MWQLAFTKRSEKDFFRLEKEVARRIVARLEKSLENPKRYYSRVKGTGYCKLRAGDYRAVVILDQSKEIIDVRRVGHRRNIYKNL